MLTLFGNINVAMPFLLDLFRIPADTFQLFLATGVVNARFGTLLAAVHTLVMALLGTCAVTGVLRIDRRKLVRFCVITAVLTFVVVGGTRLLFGRGPEAPSTTRTRSWPACRRCGTRWPATVYKPGDRRRRCRRLDGSVLDRVHDQRRPCASAISPTACPTSSSTRAATWSASTSRWRNSSPRISASRWSSCPSPRPATEESIDPAVCDLVMTGAAVVADRAMQFLYSTPYLDETLAFIMPDHRRAEFSSWDDIRAMKRLRLAVPAAPYYIAKIRAELPNAEIVPVPLQDVSRILAHQDSTIDAFVLTAERGSAFTLLHPEFSVAVPKPNVSRCRSPTSLPAATRRWRALSTRGSI